MSQNSANLYAHLRAGFPANLDATAVYDGDLHYSWRDLERGSAMMANWLLSLNLPAGSRVAMQVDKSVEALMLYLATLRSGLVLLPLNTAYQGAEMAYFIDNASPAVVVCKPQNFSWVSKLAFGQGVGHVVTLGDDRTGSLLQRAAHAPDTPVCVPVQPDDMAAILYTSGTTGRSKGAMLSHHNLLSNAEVLRIYWGWQPNDVLLHALPIFHVHGLFVAIHGALINGSPMRWMNKFEPRAAIGLMAHATVFMGVPTLYTRMLAEPTLSQASTAGMRLFISGSAPLLTETFNAWRERTGHTILERYGMSETAMLTSNPYAADARHGGATQRRGGTVGFALPGVELRITNDQGQPLPQGETGGIEVRGPNVFKGYWQMPEKTAEEFTADGFFKTGDVGRMDEQGYITIVGRNKDLIISGGYNVYPAEVEGFMNNLPGVAESALVGVAHPDFGEVGVALVVARAGANPQPHAILAELKAQLANFKVPKHVEVVDELPRNVMGKVQKNVLRQRYASLFT